MIQQSQTTTHTNNKHNKTQHNKQHNVIVPTKENSHKQIKTHTQTKTNNIARTKQQTKANTTQQTYGGNLTEIKVIESRNLSVVTQPR